VKGTVVDGTEKAIVGLLKKGSRLDRNTNRFANPGTQSVNIGKTD